MTTDVGERPIVEAWHVRGGELLAAANRLIHEGDVSRLTVEQGGRTLAEFPVPAGAVGPPVAPALAAIGAMAAFLAECTIEVERTGTATAQRDHRLRWPNDFGGD